MGKKTISNKKARFEYDIAETVEAGLELMGPEVKSLRLGRGSLAEAHVRIMGGESFLINANIPGYGFADNREYEPTRTRKLLMHKREIESWQGKVKAGNWVVVPLEIYLKRGKFKLLVGLGKGRKQYQKKELLKRRDVEREVKREWKQKLK